MKTVTITIDTATVRSVICWTDRMQVECVVSDSKGDYAQVKALMMLRSDFTEEEQKTFDGFWQLMNDKVQQLV